MMQTQTQTQTPSGWALADWPSARRVHSQLSVCLLFPVHSAI